MKRRIQNSILKLVTSSLAVLILFNIEQSKTFAQEIDPTYFSISEGLANSNIQGILQDSYGLLWISTANGLQTFDGYSFETYKNIPDNPESLLNNVAWGISEDHSQNIWVGTDMGISRFDRKNNTFYNYDLSKQFNIPGLGGRVFKVAIDSKKQLWAYTGANQLIQYDPRKDKWGHAKFIVEDNKTEAVNRGIAFGFTEDNDSSLWIGSTKFGLMRRKISDSAFRPVPIKEFDFADPRNSISRVYADSKNVIWITSRNGVHKYYPDGTFKTIKSYNYREKYLYNYWNCIREDHDGNIWIVNNFRGILKFEGISDQFQEVGISGLNFQENRGLNITLTDLMIDKSGIFWFGSQTAGLLKYDPSKKPFTSYLYDENNNEGISSNSIFGLLASENDPNLLYVGTRDNGLDIFNQELQSFRNILYSAVNDTYSGSVRSIGEDDDGTLWLGTWGDGLIELDESFQEINRYTTNPNSKKSISHNQVRVIKKDENGHFWIGTSNGLNYFQPQTGEFKQFPGTNSRVYPRKLIEEVEKIANTDLKIAEIVKVQDFQNLSQEIDIKEAGTYLIEMVGEGVDQMVDFGWLESASRDTIWTSMDINRTYHAGGGIKNRILIEEIGLEAGKYYLKYQSDDSHSFDNWNVSQPDQTDLYGIIILKMPEVEGEDLISYFLNQEKESIVISGVSIRDIEVTNTHIWVGTAENGLNKIDLKTSDVTKYVHRPEDIHSISSNSILDIYEDENGFVWVTTSEGLNRLDPNSGQFTHFTEDHGLPTNLLESILPGDNGEMWISTQAGLSHMIVNESLDKITFINYSSDDGLSGNDFIAQVAAKTANGKFYFGGDHGLNAVSKISTNNIQPEIILRDFLISNQSVNEMGKESPINTHLLDTEKVVLSHDQNNLSFEFAALHYSNSKKNQYAHFLKGYDEEWVYDNRNYASYTNLDPGNYEFIIRASNAYGVWNEEGKSIKIVILSPWWKTNWAYVSYALLLVLGIYGFDKIMRRRLKIKEQERSREKELAQAREIEKAYTELKATQKQLIQSEKMASLGELTAGIAHEIQNPLNFVNNFSDVSEELVTELREEIKKGDIEAALLISDDVVQNLKKIHNHGQRASFIVKGMLAHSRTSTGEKTPTDINVLAEEFLKLSYHGLRAKDSSFKADIKTEFDKELPLINVVSQDIGRVLLNLINNAFHAVSQKHQHLTGLKDLSGADDYKPTVVVKTKKTKNELEIKVIDNGNGIPAEVKDKIFQPFFTTKPTGEGTGLGLSLSYDIVTKGHGGELTVDTTLGQGTSFTVVIPIVA